MGRLASGSAKVDELIEWTKAEFSTVNSDKTARGYWQVPVSLGFAQVRAGVFAVTEEGRAFASSPESSALAAALASSVWGVAEMLEYLAESPATLDQLNEYLNSLGAGWKTSAQVLYRVGWLQTAGLIVQGADGLWKSA